MHSISVLSESYLKKRLKQTNTFSNFSIFFLFCFSCWMSSSGNLIWIFVSFVVAVEIVSETYSHVWPKN